MFVIHLRSQHQNCMAFQGKRNCRYFLIKVSHYKISREKYPSIKVNLRNTGKNSGI